MAFLQYVFSGGLEETSLGEKHDGKHGTEWYTMNWNQSIAVLKWHQLLGVLS